MELVDDLSVDRLPDEPLQLADLDPDTALRVLEIGDHCDHFFRIAPPRRAAHRGTAAPGHRRPAPACGPPPPHRPARSRPGSSYAVIRGNVSRIERFDWLGTSLDRRTSSASAHPASPPEGGRCWTRPASGQPAVDEEIPATMRRTTLRLGDPILLTSARRMEFVHHAETVRSIASSSVSRDRSTPRPARSLGAMAPDDANPADATSAGRRRGRTRRSSRPRRPLRRDRAADRRDRPRQRDPLDPVPPGAARRPRPGSHPRAGPRADADAVRRCRHQRLTHLRQRPRRAGGRGDAASQAARRARRLRGRGAPLGGRPRRCRARADHRGPRPLRRRRMAPRRDPPGRRQPLRVPHRDRPRRRRHDHRRHAHAHHGRRGL